MASFLEESDAILLRVGATPAAVLLSEIDLLENRHLPTCRSKKQRGQLLQSTAALRLTVMELKNQSVENCLPFAERVMAGAEPFASLESMAAFARYTQENGRPEVGLRLLQQALEAVDWTNAKKPSQQEARGLYLKLLGELENDAS